MEFSIVHEPGGGGERLSVPPGGTKANTTF